MIRNLEGLMYNMSDLFLAPVLILLMVLFAYSLFALGAFAQQFWQRKRNHTAYLQAINTQNALHLHTGAQENSAHTINTRGYPLLSLLRAHPGASRDDLDVAALHELETVRAVSRLAPMLGLIATMIPMGPALKSLADGNVQGISENLIIAFSAVIFGLVIATITFWIASIKKRWLATELVGITPLLATTPAPLVRETMCEVA